MNAPRAPEWPMAAQRDAIVSQLDSALGLHAARDKAPAGVLDADIVTECAGLLTDVTALVRTLVRDLTPPTEDIA